MKTEQKKQMANLMLCLMSSTGILDEYDEVIDDLLGDESIEFTTKFHEDVLVSIDFVNKFCDKLVDNQIYKQSFIDTFNNTIELRS